jgi:hypothetical protein
MSREPRSIVGQSESEPAGTHLYSGVHIRPKKTIALKSDFIKVHLKLFVAAALFVAIVPGGF